MSTLTNQGNVTPHVEVLPTLDANPTVAYSQLPYWVQMNGNNDDRAAQPQEDLPLYRRVIRQRLMPFLQAFLREYARPLVVILLNCSTYPYSVFETMQCLDIVYDGQNLDFHILSGNEFANKGEDAV